MSIPAQVIRQRDFSAGEIDPDAERRDDIDQFKYGVRRGRNLQFLQTGGLERRHGRKYLYSGIGRRDEFRPFSDITYSVTFGPGLVRIRDESAVVLATLPAPWTAPEVDSLVWEPVGNRLFVCGPFRTQVIEVDEFTRAWSIYDYDFDVGLEGAARAPFYRFPGTKGITLQPSALSGTFTVTASAPLFETGHVGCIFRYAGKQFLVTARTDSMHVSAQAIELLAPTWAITVASATGFTVGEIVADDTYGMNGEVVSIVGNVITVVALERMYDTNTGGKLVGPNASSTISAVAAAPSPGATVQWDEIFISDFRGWPQSVSQDSQRLIFCDFPQFKQAVIWSGISTPFDLLIGAEANAAIFEYVQAECRVYHVVGGYDEFAVTDKGVYYIPVSSDSPLVPGSVEFRIIYAAQVAPVRPVQVTEGVLFVEESRTGIFAITATGQTARPYIASEITLYHRHLFNGVKALAVKSGTPSAPSRQIFAVNADGTLVLGQYNADRGYVGWLKWEGQGAVRSISARYGDVIMTTDYPGQGGLVERIEPGGMLDAAVAGLATPFIEGSTVQVYADGFYLGNATVGAGGVVAGFAGFTDISVGFSFAWQMEPNLESVEGGQAFGQRLRRRKISKVLAKVRDTQEFRIGNRRCSGYRGGDDTALPMPLRNEVISYRQQGRSHDPTYELAQTTPGAFKLVELTTEITV